jgi:hypothetical protein
MGRDDLDAHCRAWGTHSVDSDAVAPTGGSSDHPAHYGGENDPYECIKVIEAWGLGFNVGNALKYLCRAGKKPGVDTIEDLHKAVWYLLREVEWQRRIETRG